MRQIRVNMSQVRLHLSHVKADMPHVRSHMEQMRAAMILFPANRLSISRQMDMAANEISLLRAPVGAFQSASRRLRTQLGQQFGDALL